MAHEFIASVATMGNQTIVIPLLHIHRHSLGLVFSLEQMRCYLDNEDTLASDHFLFKVQFGFLQECKNNYYKELDGYLKGMGSSVLHLVEVAPAWPPVNPKQYLVF